MFRKTTTLSYIFFIVPLLVLLASCGKSDVPKEQSTYEISYAGELELGEPITFQSTAPANSVYLWLFGDGNNSLQPQPTYTYYSISHIGNAITDDTVTLIANNDIYRPSIKTFRLKPGNSKITGTHIWKGGSFTLHRNCCPGFSDHPLNDTTFGITNVDDYTISSWGIKLPYQVDSNYYSNDRRADRYNATTITYTKDTIFFLQRSGTDTGWAEVSYYHTF